MPLDRFKSRLPNCPREAARIGDFSTALGAIGAAATGQPGYLATETFVLAGAGDLPVINAAGMIQTQMEEQPDDGVLGLMGLRLLQVPAASAKAPGAASVAALDMRLGLFTLLLQTAHDHLKPRKSFGVKTLHHQLVKADFGDASGTLVLLQSKLAYRRATGDFAGIALDHATLSSAEVQAEKLMGGHGYLAGGTHQISYLSMLVRGLYGGAAS